MTEEKEYKYAEIVGYEDYLIYEDGRVFSKKTRKILKASLGNHGYLYHNLRSTTGVKKPMNVHRLVALHFVPNPGNKRDVDHIDGCKTNNVAMNLRWATRSENMMNRGLQCNNSSGEKNVYFFKRDQTWQVQFKIKGKKLHYGYFKQYDDAVKFARQKRQELHGEFACDE
jgi:hypothetical protein